MGEDEFFRFGPSLFTMHNAVERIISIYEMSEMNGLKPIFQVKVTCKK